MAAGNISETAKDTGERQHTQEHRGLIRAAGTAQDDE
jgi:hypothetical protein